MVGSKGRGTHMRDCARRLETASRFCRKLDYILNGVAPLDSLVSTEWLAAQLGSPDLVVFDATKYLPNEPKDGRAEYLSAHVPGARYFDIDEFADADTDLPHMVPAPGRFAKLIGALGVSNASRVVFYDQKGLASAARGWWLMGLFGHDNAAVLDGGLPKWIREGRPVERGEPPPPPPPRSARIFGRAGCAASATCWPMSRRGPNWCWMLGPPAALRVKCRSPAPECAAAIFPDRRACPTPTC